MAVSLLIEACSNCDTKEALKLIAEDKIDIGLVDNMNMTALAYACLNNMSEVAHVLACSRKANTHVIGRYRNTALHWACKNGMTKVIDEIIDIDSDNVGIVGFLNKTPLMILCYDPLMSKQIHKIIETGMSNPNAYDANGETALHIACKFQLHGVIAKLLRVMKFESIYRRNSNGHRALEYYRVNSMTIDNLCHSSWLIKFIVNNVNAPRDMKIKKVRGTLFIIKKSDKCYNLRQIDTIFDICEMLYCVKRYQS